MKIQEKLHILLFIQRKKHNISLTNQKREKAIKFNARIVKKKETLRI
jgi:hypothetical protein